MARRVYRAAGLRPAPEQLPRMHFVSELAAVHLPHSLPISFEPQLAACTGQSQDLQDMVYMLVLGFVCRGAAKRRGLGLWPSGCC